TLPGHAEAERIGQLRNGTGGAWSDGVRPIRTRDEGEGRRGLAKRPATLVAAASLLSAAGRDGRRRRDGRDPGRRGPLRARPRGRSGEPIRLAMARHGGPGG